jgi:hypothetical protein
VHLTKNTKAENGRSAFKNLVKILRTGKILGSENKKGKGFIKGPHLEEFRRSLESFFAATLPAGQLRMKVISQRCEPGGMGVISLPSLK